MSSPLRFFLADPTAKDLNRRERRGLAEVAEKTREILIEHGLPYGKKTA
jgi:hypothetical protein